MSAFSTHTVEVTWGPGFIFGMTFTMVLFGISVCQVVFYYRSFPNDSRWLKLGVFAVLILDTFHTTCVLAIFWHILVACHRARSADCQMSFNWDLLGGLGSSYIITLSVQSFYIHRVWIISRGNKVVTGALVLIGASQILFGILAEHTALFRNWSEILSHSTSMVLATSAGSICDILITISIGYFLRTGKSRSSSQYPVNRIKRICVESGLMSSALSIVTVAMLVFLPEIGQYWALAPGTIVAKAYVNSMLAVLNTRVIIRERQLHACGQMFDLTTIHRTHTHLNL